MRILDAAWYNRGYDLSYCWRLTKNYRAGACVPLISQNFALELQDFRFQYQRTSILH